MKVYELIEALKKCDQTLNITAWNEDDNNEFSVRVVTKSRSGVLLANSESGVTDSEIVIHSDFTSDDGQFGVGA